MTKPSRRKGTLAKTLKGLSVARSAESTRMKGLAAIPADRREAAVKRLIERTK